MSDIEKEFLNFYESLTYYDNKNKEYINKKADENAIAKEFDATKSGGYNVDDLVYYQGDLYKCIKQYIGAWDSNNFSITTIADSLASASPYINEISHTLIFP